MLWRGGGLPIWRSRTRAGGGSGVAGRGAVARGVPPRGGGDASPPPRGHHAVRARPWWRPPTRRLGAPLDVLSPPHLAAVGGGRCARPTRGGRGGVGCWLWSRRRGGVRAHTPRRRLGRVRHGPVHAVRRGPAAAEGARVAGRPSLPPPPSPSPLPSPLSTPLFVAVLYLARPFTCGPLASTLRPCPPPPVHPCTSLSGRFLDEGRPSGTSVPWRFSSSVLLWCAHPPHLPLFLCLGGLVVRFLVFVAAGLPWRAGGPLVVGCLGGGVRRWWGNRFMVVSVACVSCQPPRRRNSLLGGRAIRSALPRALLCDLGVPGVLRPLLYALPPLEETGACSRPFWLLLIDRCCRRKGWCDRGVAAALTDEYG